MSYLEREAWLSYQLAIFSNIINTVIKKIKTAAYHFLLLHSQTHIFSLHLQKYYLPFAEMELPFQSDRTKLLERFFLISALIVNLSLVDCQLRFSTTALPVQNRAVFGFNNDSNSNVNVNRQIAHFPLPPATWSTFATPPTSWSWASVPKPGFMIQMSNVSYNDILNGNYTYYVLEPSTSPLTAQQITDLRSRGKVILARLAIGQADRSLPYWQAQWTDRPPEFLDKEDLARPGTVPSTTRRTILYN